VSEEVGRLARSGALGTRGRRPGLFWGFNGCIAPTSFALFIINAVVVVAFVVVQLNWSREAAAGGEKGSN